jgi:adenylate kinase family enzyme
MVREELVGARAAGGGYVLDEIPRNMQQARAAYLIACDLGMTADAALHLDATAGFLVPVDAMRRRSRPAATSSPRWTRCARC